MKLIKKAKTALILISCVLISESVVAQFKNEIGLFGGCSFYMGDANRRRLFYNVGPAYGIFYKYNFTQRWVLGAQVGRATVFGDTRDFKDIFPNDAEASFKRDFWDAHLRAEFNFYNYTIREGSKEEKRFSPYIFAGIGLTAYNDKYKGDPRVTMNVPVGVGFRVKLHRLVNLGVEWSFTHLFIDDFDVVNKESEILKDPYGVGRHRFKNNDWYSFAMIYLSFNIFDNKMKCW